MITMLFYMTVKPGRVEAFREIITQSMISTRAEDVGCINYVFYQQHDNPQEFMLYEQWQDQAALDAHLARIDLTIGFARFFEMCEFTKMVSYDIVV